MKVKRIKRRAMLFHMPGKLYFGPGPAGGCDPDAAQLFISNITALSKTA